MFASPCWTRWRVGTKCNDSLVNITWHQETNTNAQPLITNASATQIRTGVVEQTVTFCDPEGISGIKRLRDGSFLMECARKPQAMSLLKTTRFVDRPVRVSIHKALNASRGVIHCREKSGMTEAEIKKDCRKRVFLRSTK